MATCPNEWYNQQLDDFLSGTLKPEILFQVGKFPAVCGYPALDMIMKQSVVTKGFNDHGLSESDFRDLPRKTRDLTAVFASKRPSSIVLQLALRVQGEALCIPMYREPKHRVFADCWIVCSYYTRAEHQYQCWRDEELLLWEKKKPSFCVSQEAAIASGEQELGSP